MIAYKPIYFTIVESGPAKAGPDSYC